MKILIKGYQTTMFDKESKEILEDFIPCEKMGKKDMHTHMELPETMVICDRKYETKEIEISETLYNEIIEESGQF